MKIPIGVTEATVHLFSFTVQNANFYSALKRGHLCLRLGWELGNMLTGSQKLMRKARVIDAPSGKTTGNFLLPLIDAKRGCFYQNRDSECQVNQ